METPSSTRRITRSQALAAQNSATMSSTNNIPISRKIEDTEKGIAKSRQRTGKKQQDRSALVDITNDSPIVGLASMGSLETPSSAISKQRSARAKNSTPGSGEALLRGQVKTLLQKVEEEAELSKMAPESRPIILIQGFVNSPMGLLAPTPANTPQVENLSGEVSLDNSELASVTPVVVEEQLKISQVVNDIFDGKKQETLDSQKSLITRSLLLDFSEKSESSDSSECFSDLTYQGTLSHKTDQSNKDDDEASNWSIQVNASAHDEDEDQLIENDDDEEEDEGFDDDYEEDAEEDGIDGGLVDELCEGICNIRVTEKRIAKFTGKHTRFVYDSEEEEIVEEKECVENEDPGDVSPGVLRLKGLPTPKGKHLRFPEEEEDSGN